MSLGQGQTKRILYFSSKCRHCDEFSRELNRSGVSSTFQQICIDYTNDPFTGKPVNIPRFLKKVPTLYIKDNPNGRAKVYAGQQAFEWLRHRGSGGSVLNQQQVPQRQPQPQQQQGISSNLTPESLGFPNGGELNQNLPMPHKRGENGQFVNEGLMDVGLNESGFGSASVSSAFSGALMDGSNDPRLSMSRDSVRHGQVGYDPSVTSVVSNSGGRQEKLEPGISCSKADSDDLMKLVQQKQQRYGA